jgi:putative tryptophan/tyrosine transport system substrate-binding protein
MKRREFITLLGGAAAAWPRAAGAQQADSTARQVRVGLIAASPPTPSMLNAFRDGMRERGYAEGQDLSVAADISDVQEAARVVGRGSSS